MAGTESQSWGRRRGGGRGWLWLALLVAPLAMASCQDTSAAEEAATRAALQWLQLIDEGRYTDSWDSSSSVFQQSITREAWDSSLSEIRGPLGKTLSRTLGAADYTDQIAKVPKGEYVQIRFETSFENRVGTTERVTLSSEGDAWRISGYFIQ